MSKLFYSANGQAFKSTYKNIIERMTETTPEPQKKIDNSLDLVGNLEIKGDIKAMRYLDVNGNALSFADPKGTYTIGSITDKQGQIGVGVLEPKAQLHVGKSLRVEEDIKMNDSSKMCIGDKCLNNQSIENLNKTQSKNISHEIYEIAGNIAHPDRGDGMIYRADGQVQFATDDLIRLRHVGSKQTGIQFDTSPGIGNIKNPDGTMKISRSGIMFGGNNGAGKEQNSAQISAGIHEPNSLNIVGMSMDNNPENRKVDVWAQGTMTIRGPTQVWGNVKKSGDLISNGGNNWIFHTPDDQRRSIYIAPSSTYGKEDWNWSNGIEIDANGKIINRNGINQMKDNRNEKLLPKDYRAKGIGKYTEFKYQYITENNQYIVLETTVPWPDISGGRIKQLAYADDGVYYRTGLQNDSAWENFKKIQLI
jgi:hypothetical protein